MARYIDAENLIETLKNPPLHNSLGGMCMQDVFDIIEDLPAEDVAPVVHSRWEEQYDIPGSQKFCMNCGCGENIFSYNHDFYEYCPHCGAKMDEVSK